MSKNKHFSSGLFTAKAKLVTIKEHPLYGQIAEYLNNRGTENDCQQCGAVKTKNGKQILFLLYQRILRLEKINYRNFAQKQG